MSDTDRVAAVARALNAMMVGHGGQGEPVRDKDDGPVPGPDPAEVPAYSAFKTRVAVRAAYLEQYRRFVGRGAPPP